MENNNLTIYTDGCSKGNPGVGGYGIVFIYPDGKEVEKKQGYRLTTNNRMELMAVLVALQSLDKSHKIDLYSDSKYIVDAFNLKWIDSWIKENFRIGKKDEVKNIDLWKALLLEVNKHDISFNWVKGHSNIKYNERCDKLANESINEQLIPDFYYEIMKDKNIVVE